MAALIQDVPVNAYQEVVGARKQQWGKKPQQTKKHNRRSKDNDFDLDDDILFDDDDTIAMLSENLMISDLTKRFNDRITAAADQKLRDSEDSSDHNNEMRALLLEYRKELLEAVQFMKAKNESVPPIIEEAIKYINLQMGFKHWAGS
jgi:hypothetical protein